MRANQKVVMDGSICAGISILAAIAGRTYCKRNEEFERARENLETQAMTCRDSRAMETLEWHTNVEDKLKIALKSSSTWQQRSVSSLSSSSKFCGYQ